MYPTRCSIHDGLLTVVVLHHLHYSINQSPWSAWSLESGEPAGGHGNTKDTYA